MAGNDIPVSFMLGGYTMREGDVYFDWNFTFTRNRSDPFKRLGLLAVHNKDARIWQMSVHEKFSIRSEKKIKNNQKGFLVAQNDYHNVKIPITLIVNNSGLAGWAIALIVIGSLAVAAGIGFVIKTRLLTGSKRPLR